MLGNLTDRQGQIMDLVARGLMNKDIADKLNISEQTVKNHVTLVLTKLGAANRTDATRLWLQQHRRQRDTLATAPINARHEVREIALRDHQFLKQLCQPWSAYGGSEDDKIIKIVAVQGLVDDWAAYMEMPWTPSGADGVINLGNKMPQNVAEELFPSWAKKYTYRP